MLKRTSGTEVIGDIAWVTAPPAGGHTVPRVRRALQRHR